MSHIDGFKAIDIEFSFPLVALTQVPTKDNRDEAWPDFLEDVTINVSLSPNNTSIISFEGIGGERETYQIIADVDLKREDSVSIKNIVWQGEQSEWAFNHILIPLLGTGRGRIVGTKDGALWVYESKAEKSNKSQKGEDNVRA